MDAIDLTLIRTRISPEIAYDMLDEFESAIERDGRWTIVEGPRSRWRMKLQAAADLVLHPLAARIATPRRFVSLGFGLADWRLWLKGGASIQKALPYFGLDAELKALWMCDAWPATYARIERALQRWGVDVLMTSSKQSAQALRRRDLAGVTVEWVPEGISVDRYRRCALADKSIDVLQIGRQWRWYHDQIAQPCRQWGIRYLHPTAATERGAPLFATRDELVEGLARAKIAICAPRAITHPEAAGGVVTMTSRYLQAMASKCLVVGVCPDEMRELFGYDPVVSVDRAAPAEQLRHLLQRFGDYLPLVERNYAEVRARHQWPTRMRQIEACIARHDARAEACSHAA